MERPLRRNTDVLQIAAERMATDIVKRWDTTGNAEDWVAPLMERGLIARGYDGYKLARELESYGIDPDSDLVEVLDDVSHHLDDAHSEEVERWVKFMNIRPERKEGDVVSWTSGRGVLTGTIRTIMEERAYYVIAPPEDPKFQNGGGYMVNYEDVRDPEQAAA